MALPLVACGGGGKNDVVASVSGVFPPEVFLGRTTEVLVSGSGTNWNEGTAIDFGEGVTVEDVVVSSPSALYATITVAPDAESGPRDVTVDGAALTGAFRLASPISVDSVEGTLAQGSLVLIKLKNEDLLNPFDTTAVSTGLFTPPSYPNVTIDTPDGMQALPVSVDLYSMQVQLLIDVSAASGSLDLNVYSGADDDTLQFVKPAALEVEARDATEITAGTPESAAVSDPLESHLYSLSPASLSIINLAIQTDTAMTTPQFILLGPSGSFNEWFAQSSANLATDELQYLVVLDTGGSTGFQFTLSSSAVEADSIDHAEPNDSDTEAQEVTPPMVVQSATLADQDDEDWYKVVAKAEDVGKTLKAFTDGGDPLTDTEVVIWFDDPVDGLTVVADSGDDDYHEVVTGTVDAEGDYYVQVIASPDYFNPARNTYEASVLLED